uniref:RRM domain-containing protein n=1 Tax=Leersia perrieri TaxID=77586 RepID=A0A0D9V644_9ORYZ
MGITKQQQRARRAGGEAVERAVTKGKGAAAASRAENGKLFVGGVPLGASAAELRAHFSRFGRVACVFTHKDHDTGASRGFAFVQFVCPDDADAALAACHVFRGTTIDVKVAEPKPSAEGPQRRLSGDHKKIFIGGLPPSLREETLKEYFEKFGQVYRATVVTDVFTNVSRGFGFVEYESVDSATKVLKMGRHFLGGQWVDVRVAIPKPEQDQQQSDAAASGTSRLSAQARPFCPARSSSLLAANSTVNNAPVIAPAKYIFSDNINPYIGYVVPGVLLSQDVINSFANLMLNGFTPLPQGSGALMPQAAHYSAM